MIISDFSRRVPKDFNLYLLGDAHVGNGAMAEKPLWTAVNMIKDDDKGFCITGGDMCEAIHLGDKRFEPAVHMGKYATADKQAAHVAALLDPIQGKVLAALDGNHELKYANIVDYTDLWCRRLDNKIKRGGYSIKAKFSKDFRLFYHHGMGSVNSRAGDRRQMETNDGISIKRKLRHLMGDCNVMAMAHIHKLRICPPIDSMALVGDGKLSHIYPSDVVSKDGYIPEDYRWFCSTGSFLTTFVDNVTTYSERAMYSPTEIGMMKITVEKGRAVAVDKVIL